MKKLILIFLAISCLLSSCSIGQNLITYTIYSGKSFPEPSLTGTIKDTLEAYIFLDSTWNQLYLNSDNSTHKIIGIGNLFGSNSLRLGVRRAPNKLNGLVAVNYYHKNGKFYYPALKDSTGKNLILNFETGYYVKIFKTSIGWKIEVYENLKPPPLSSAVDSISISSFGRRIQGPYIEVGSGPSLWKIITKIKIIKQ